MSGVFDAWYLPGFTEQELSFTSYQLGTLSIRAPLLDVDQLHRVFAHLTEVRSQLAAIDTRDVVSAIDTVAARFADPESREGAAARTLLPAVTGYSPETIEDILQHMAHDWSRASLDTLLAAELDNPRELDEPAADPAAPRTTFARGPRCAFQVFAGNVPGVAVTSLIRCLLVKGVQLGKTASGEPVLPVLFAHALANVAPALAQCLAVTYWPGGSEQLESVALETADTVIVYGGAAVVAAISDRAPAHTRVVVHGPKLSIGIVGRDASVDIAPHIAYAVAAYDQQGCVSPHAVFVERGGAIDPEALAAAIAHDLARLAATLPRRTIDHSEAIAIRNARARAEFRAIAGERIAIHASTDTSYTVIYDEHAALNASCLNRTLHVMPIDDARTVSALLRPHHGVMQSVAIAGFTANQARNLGINLAQCGVTRVTSFADLPWPPMWWHHDGRGPLRELLTWYDLET